MNPGLRIPLRIVFYQEDGAMIAHCLEFDLLGSGASHEEAIQSLSDAIDMQIEVVLESGNLANLFSPAPGEYLRMFAAGQSDSNLGKAVAALKFHLDSLDVTEVDCREYRENGPTEENLAMA